jgi:hypothetical protein
MEVMAINIKNTVKNIPKMMFNHRLIEGFKRIDRQTIKQGIAKSADAKNNFVGLSKIFDPLTSSAVF